MRSDRGALGEVTITEKIQRALRSLGEGKLREASHFGVRQRLTTKLQHSSLTLSFQRLSVAGAFFQTLISIASHYFQRQRTWNDFTEDVFDLLRHLVGKSSPNHFLEEESPIRTFSERNLLIKKSGRRR